MYEPRVGKCFESFPMSDGGRVCVRIPFGDIIRSVFFENCCTVVDRDKLKVHFICCEFRCFDQVEDALFDMWPKRLA